MAASERELAEVDKVWRMQQFHFVFGDQDGFGVKEKCRGSRRLIGGEEEVGGALREVFGYLE